MKSPAKLQQVLSRADRLTPLPPHVTSVSVSRRVWNGVCVDVTEFWGHGEVCSHLWTEICLAMPAIHALADGYEVFAVTDASGGVSAEAHDMAVRRMVAAGVAPITWLAVTGEWQRDWARERSVKALAEILGGHGGGSGIAFAWEMQLLESRS